VKGWVAHKFGGTSVAGAERYRGVAAIVGDLPGARKAVVVSAMSKVTDALIEAAELAAKRRAGYKAKLRAIEERHLQTAAELLPETALAPLAKRIQADFRSLAEVLRGVWLTRTCAERTVELVSGHGELWSAQLLCAYLNSRGERAAWLDARKVLVVEPGETGVAVDWKASGARLRAWLKKNPTDLLVITGFIASTPEGVPTTLKRNGSDHSGSIFGALLGASEISIWTDVDGVLSADPRLVPEAVVLSEMSYREAAELAYFGAKVVHPHTMEPAIRAKIPIRIRNTFNPKAEGTWIRERAKAAADHPVKGFSTADRMALVSVEGTGMIGVPGVAQRLFGALREVGVSVTLISQASSEQSICFAIPAAQAKTAEAAVRRAFFAELHHGQIQRIVVEKDCSILAAVGDGMAKTPGVAARFFSALAKAGVNVRAIAQGSSERNISAVVAAADAGRALRAAHAAFFLSPQTLSIGLIGPGLIGRTLLAQLEQETERLRREFRLDLRVRAVADSKRMLLADKAVELGDWKGALERGRARDLGAFLDHVRAEHLPHAVLIDCTSDPALAARYAEWLGRGFHVITPNKKANSGTMAYYRELRRAARAANRHYLYETTVGAGLPVINTLRDLVQTGDRILKIEGILSGTLSFLFSALGEKGARFSEAVGEARRRGYTEPDPRDDLSGTDVARKLVILAREAGLEVELADVEIESLVPPALRSGTVDHFLEKLPSHDGAMAARLKDAAARGEVLRYVGSVSPEGCRVAVRAYPAEHPFAGVRGGDNIVAFTTARYKDQPLVVRGPGAGPEVTAAGVFADVLRLAAYLGAPL